MKQFEGLGRGVVTTRQLSRGDYVLEYVGDVLTKQEAEQREAEYRRDATIGSYMYYMQYGGQTLW